MVHGSGSVRRAPLEARRKYRDTLNRTKVITRKGNWIALGNVVIFMRAIYSTFRL